MNIKRFKENIASLMLNPSGDEAYACLRLLTHGMAGIRTAKLLNFASSCMDPDDFYMEIGTFTGFTLISASYQNNSHVIGVDDFSVKDIVRSDISQETKKKTVDNLRLVLTQNIQSYGTPHCRFIESDFRNVTLNEDARGKLSVLFIDATHDYDNVKETYEKFKLYLSKDAVLIFDDVQFREIPKFIHELCLQDYEMLFHVVSSINDHDEKVHLNMNLNGLVANGISVLVRKEVVDA